MFSFDDVKMCEGPKIGAQGVDKCATNVLNTSVNHNNDHQNNTNVFSIFSMKIL